MNPAQATLAQRQLLVAPFLGALAGLLFHRVHAGAGGWALAGEILAGAVLATIGAAIMAQLDALARERARRAALLAAQNAAQSAARRAELVRAEQQRYLEQRLELERRLESDRRAQDLELELSRTRRDTVQLANVVAGLVQRMRHDGSAAEAVALAEEARRRMAAVEAAQQELALRQVELDRKTAGEAEEVKARLLQLSVTDSQRRRNIEAPDSDASGRIIELEARIRKLAREIERLSARQPVAAEQGEAGTVAPGGTRDGARLGFLRAMLEANQTLRRQIKAA
ncbi:MAG: hypothetical protein HS108_11665 [Planctomycetes bacterium]|nr:hypothetical protein [Planctomycetota bacterium]MCL4731671.1 hypothetical protein [Planctomycetota bacterium]